MRNPFTLIAVWIFLSNALVISAAPLAADPWLVRPISGPAFSGKLNDIRADGTLSFAIAGQTEPRSLPLADLVRWGEWRKVQPGPRVYLHDDGFVGAEVLQITAQNIVADSIEGLGEITMPRAAVRAIVLQPLRWKSEKPIAVKKSGPTEANLILVNGDRREGQLAGWEPGALKWQTGAQTLRVPLSSVVAVEFPPLAVPAIEHPDAAAKSPSTVPRFWLGFKDGSRVLANMIVRDKNHWRIGLAGGGEILAEVDSLVALQPLGGRGVYLSDLPAAGYKSIPWLTTTWDYLRDRNVTGGELRVAGSLALKGLGMHSASRLTYDLDKQYARFAARVGIDDSTAGRGHATARIYGDRGTGAWELLHETPALDGGTAPPDIDVEISGLQRLALVVDFAGDGDAGDHVDWLDARLIKK